MNERIEQALYQSGLTAQGCWDELDDYAKEGIEKFAELIVQECKQAVADGLKSMKYTSFDVSYISRLVDPINTELDRILK
jgi:hypothetical protein